MQFKLQNTRYFFIFLIGWGGLATSVQAKDTSWIEWQTANIQLLQGWDYAVGPENRTIVTIEYANRWKYGDFFMFVDAIRYDTGGSVAYTELSPRFSLSKMTGYSFALPQLAIKDMYISTMYEKGRADVETFLYGGAIDFDFDGFVYFKTNLYVRDRPSLDAETWQLTVAWNRPFEIEGVHFLAEGFADIAGNAGSRYHANQLAVPRLLIDVGDLAGYERNQLYAGMEYSYWHNKFGIKGVTESAPQLQLKWVF